METIFKVNYKTPGNLSSLALLQKTDKPLLNCEITLGPTPYKYCAARSLNRPPLVKSPKSVRTLVLNINLFLPLLNLQKPGSLRRSCQL
jgi:hypothetical protein